MDTLEINAYLLELVQETSEELLKIYFDKPNRKTLLKFPRYKNETNGTIRISEQELRFTLTNLNGKLPKPRLFYSVETPTKEVYSFSSKGKRSALSDMSFYNNGEKVLNIELKARNPVQDAIDKDIEKLVRENCNGAWIQILKSEDRGTVKRLFEKFEEAFKKFPISQKPISFHILILETKTLLSRKGKENETDYSKKVFNIKYELWNELKNKPGIYQFYNGHNLITEEHQKEDWQIDIFDI